MKHCKPLLLITIALLAGNASAADSTTVQGAANMTTSACPNLPGHVGAVPLGMTRDTIGNCVPNSVSISCASPKIMVNGACVKKIEVPADVFGGEYVQTNSWSPEATGCPVQGNMNNDFEYCIGHQYRISYGIDYDGYGSGLYRWAIYLDVTPAFNSYGGFAGEPMLWDMRRLPIAYGPSSADPSSYFSAPFNTVYNSMKLIDGRSLSAMGTNWTVTVSDPKPAAFRSPVAPNVSVSQSCTSADGPCFISITTMSYPGSIFTSSQNNCYGYGNAFISSHDGYGQGQGGYCYYNGDDWVNGKTASSLQWQYNPAARSRTMNTLAPLK